MTIEPGHGLGNTRAPLNERKDDLYETPAVAVEALMRVESLPHVLWEPACGRGAIARVLRSAGHQVLATDLVAYGTTDQDHAGWDFLMESRAPVDVEAIITNPPYKNAEAFIAKALDLCPRVYMLLRLAFLEGVRRGRVLDTGHLARVHVFRNRLPRMHRDGWDGPTATSMIAFAWFAWDRHHAGPTILRRLSWVEKPS